MDSPTLPPFFPMFAAIYREACAILGRTAFPIDFLKRFHETDAAFDWVTNHEPDQVNILNLKRITLNYNIGDIVETLGMYGTLWNSWRGISSEVAQETTKDYLENLSNFDEKTKDAAETMPGSAGRMRESRRHYREAVQNIDARARAAWPHTVDETEALLAIAHRKGAETDVRTLAPFMQVELVPQPPDSEFQAWLGIEEPKPPVPDGEAVIGARYQLERFIAVVDEHAREFADASDRCRDDCRAELRRLATVIQWAADAWQLGKR